MKKSAITFSVVILLTLIFSLNSYAQPKGDVNCDWVINLSDPICIANYYLKGGPEPLCFWHGDVTGECILNLADCMGICLYYFGLGYEFTTDVICGLPDPVNPGSSVNTEFNEDDPFITPDETGLYFTSDRTDGFGGYDIWWSEREDEESPWDDAQNIGSEINSSYDELSPSLTEDGQKLYFASDRSGGYGLYDVWVSEWDTIDLQWGTPENLGPKVNTSGDETSPYIIPDGSLIFLRSTGWGKPGGALYKAVWGGCSWDTTIDLGEVINQTGTEDDPFITFYGEYGKPSMYFSRDDSTRLIYRSLYREGSDTMYHLGCVWGEPKKIGPPIEPDSGGAWGPLATFDCEGIYFVSDRNGGLGGSDIWESESTYYIPPPEFCLETGNCVDFQASWSPESTTIAFVGGSIHEVEDTTPGIYLINSDGTDERLFFAGVDVWYPDWSPDGNWIAFVDDARIFKIKEDGDSLTLLAFEERSWAPSWSADGNKIAYDVRVGDSMGVWVMNSDGQNQTRILIGARTPDWSPDNEHLVYTFFGDLWIADTNGANATQIITTGERCEHPKWSPDGSKIVFVSQRKIWVVNSDGTGLKQLSIVDGDYPDWSPDGNFILFTDRTTTDGRLWIMDADGCNRRQITFCN